MAAHHCLREALGMDEIDHSYYLSLLNNALSIPSPNRELIAYAMGEVVMSASNYEPGTCYMLLTQAQYQ